MKTEKIKINRIIKKILFPNKFWALLFYGTWLGVFFFHLYPYDRTIDNLISWFLICFVMYSPFYILGENDGDGFLDDYKWFQKFKYTLNSSKVLQAVFMIVYLSLLFWMIDKYSLNRL